MYLYLLALGTIEFFIFDISARTCNDIEKRARWQTNGKLQKAKRQLEKKMALNEDSDESRNRVIGIPVSNEGDNISRINCSKTVVAV